MPNKRRRLVAKDKDTLIRGLASRWSRLLAEDTNTAGFWEDAYEVLGFEGQFSPAEAARIKEWVRVWAERVTTVRRRRRT